MLRTTSKRKNMYNGNNLEPSPKKLKYIIPNLKRKKLHDNIKTLNVLINSTHINETNKIKLPRSESSERINCYFLDFF